MKDKLKVGLEVWVIPNSRTHTKKRYCSKITKVGKKYFTVPTIYGNDKSYSIETLHENIDSNYKNRIVLDINEYLGELDFVKLKNKIESYFDWQNKSKFKLNLEQLRRIDTIINEENEGN